MYANLDGVRQLPQRGARGRCPLCDSEVIAKCGEINAWHWAHLRLDCDPWSEGESAWHLGWKNLFPEAWREVVVGNHRADIRTPGGLVIEFQKSALSTAQIQEREDCYSKPGLVWVWDATEAFTENRLSLREKEHCTGFRWRHPRKSITACESPLFLDIDGYMLDHSERMEWPGLLEVKQLFDDALFSGWGQVRTPAQFLHRVNQWETIRAFRCGRSAA